MKFQKLITWVCIFGLTIIMGCALVQEGVTPCFISEEVIKATNTDVPIIPWMPYTSLFDAKYVKTKLYYQYLLYNNLMTTSIQAGELFQQKLFSPEGPIGLLLPTIFGGTLGALLIPRSKDKEKIRELENGTHTNS